ncbi:carboxylesterase/lipase family protein [Pseudonocardia lacus]|uniref:carboxylesterase/lipase family protein n=1 Tax=Pseudonocardia lacus TaxID=2835865 RepID=UPI001BDC2E63|nr:carboxylesterase family protein [Pseudonocardia lacus]
MRRHRALRAAALTALTAAALASCAAPAPAPTPPGGPPVVMTADGPVRGAELDGVDRFRAIPYAAPPVDELRFRGPRPPAPWTDVRDATALPPACTQSWERGQDGAPVVTGDEDCLYLGLDVPRERSGPLPVMVFLHGGGFSSGQGAVYDAARVADRGDVVVVTLNYRLGAFGWMAHPALDDPDAGNLGLADQQAALRWVRDNVAAFGGDPGNVTLWGESAGGFGVCAQLAAPGARRLFHKAVVQSAPCSNPMLPRADAERRGLARAAAAGCPDPATAAGCLRALPPERLVTVYAEDVGQVGALIADAPFLPVVGTATLPEHPIDAIRDGSAADLPMIHGGTRDENTARVAQFRDLAGNPVTAESYPGDLAALYGPRAGASIAAEYPAADFPTPGTALATALTDHGATTGACTQPALLDAPARTAPTYAYEFVQPVADRAGELVLGTPHGADVPFFFDSAFPGARPSTRTPEEQRLADQLIDHWASFARTGAPGPDWPTYRDGGFVRLSAEGTAAVDVAAEHRCAFWAGLAQVLDADLRPR